ncbi:dihydrolipoyl dehydrogenase [Chelativorans salis]|uniref:Dihydrolipoyl dehydrogenase n=1 Tax=Chelativorans salis TaxID=2978478 RepID=A0ABT2LVD9_9HYPH|nr:dihydrolipoyl dehydrogenase [Chelativorans sp. EGI FJ00035]MCT7378503.1 dihydrolipoyl dehydrogenase [Chelativorans sp. EGI FJ00035]
MREISCKLLIIGAGPGGYVCAIRAGQFGIDTVVVEVARPGGTCLNVGCIPSKALIHAADAFARIKAAEAGESPLGIELSEPRLDLQKTIAWKDQIVGRLTNGVSGLLKKANVKIVHGRARFRDGKTVEVDTETGLQVIRSENVVIATGSAPVEVDALPFGHSVISSTEALSLGKAPESLAVIGAGYIGLEIGTAYAKLGTNVTVVEAEQRLLPNYDAELSGPVARRLDALGVASLTRARAKGMAPSGQLLVDVAGSKEVRLNAEKVLVAVGRRPVTDGWGREELVLDMDGPFIRIDEKCRTSMRGIYAIGDVTGEPMLAHRAMAQGEMVAEIVADRPRAWDKRCIPAICFTDPEIVTVGLLPEEAKTSGRDVRIGHFPFTANARAMTTEAEEGFMRVVARADNHVVLGIQAVGNGVSELAAAFTLAVEMGARLEDVAGTIHAHPTQGEAFQEAALNALGHPLHI